MAVSTVQTQTGSVTAGTSFPISMSTTTTGNPIVVIIEFDSPTGSVSSVVDGTNTYTQVSIKPTMAGSGSKIAVYVARNPTGLTTPTITVTMGQSGNPCGVAKELAGYTDRQAPYINVMPWYRVNDSTTPTTIAAPKLISVVDQGIVIGVLGRGTTTSGSSSVAAPFTNHVQVDASTTVSLHAAEMVLPQQMAAAPTFTVTNAIGSSADLLTVVLATTPGEFFVSGPHLEVGDGMSRSEIAN